MDAMSARFGRWVRLLFFTVFFPAVALAQTVNQTGPNQGTANNGTGGSGYGGAGGGGGNGWVWFWVVIAIIVALAVFGWGSGGRRRRTPRTPV